MRLLLLTVLALSPIISHAIEPGRFEPLPFFTWGARIGFNATGTYIDKAVFDGKRLADYEQDTQVGSFIALQFRFNSSRLFFQSGIGISSNKSSVEIDRNSWDKNNQTHDYIAVSYNTKSFMVPIQAGYHIVNQSPYCMSVFTGPRLRYSPDDFSTTSFSNQSPFVLAEEQKRFSVGWTIGLSVQIQRTFLDFEYEAGITNTSKRLYDTGGTTPDPEFEIGHRISVLSFSYGIMF